MRGNLIKNRLQIGTRFAMHNEVFEVAHVDASTIRYASTQGGRPRSIPLLSFWQLEEDGIIGFLGETMVPEVDAINIGLHQLSESQRAELQRRMLYVKAMLAQDYQPHSAANRRQTIAYVAEKHNDAKPPSPQTLSRWASDFLKSRGNPKSLVPRHDRKGPRYSKLALEVELQIGSKLRTEFLDDRRATGEQLRCNVVGELARQGWLNGSRKAPSASTIYRRIKALDPYVLALKRYGKRFADKRLRAAGQSLEVSRPMEIAMIDGHVLDILVVDSLSHEVLGRPYLVCIIDVYTRCVVGWYISLMPFCATTALAAIKHMCARDPTVEPGGVPEKLLPDNGLDFASNAMRNTCNLLGIHILPAKARCPDDKAHLERFFRTLNEQLIHMIPGTTFSNPSDRGEYESGKKAAVTLAELRTLFDKWLRTVYEVHVHSGTGRAPKLDWRDCQSEWPIAHHSSFEVDVIARVIYRRRISNGRVLVDHLFYKSDALATLEAKGVRDVTVGVDELDLSFVYVSHPGDIKSLIRADAVKARYTHELTKYEHEAAKKKLTERRKRDLVELGEYAYEIARWELWQDLHKLRNARSSKRLAALRQQQLDRIELASELKPPSFGSMERAACVDAESSDFPLTEASPNNLEYDDVKSSSAIFSSSFFDLLDI